MTRLAEVDLKQLVPDVTGLDLAKAEKVLRQKGLSLRRVLYRPGGMESAGEKVLAQQPAPGEATPDGLLDVTVGRRSFMAYLPEVMQKEDARAGSFLERFLWIVQYLWSGFQGTMDRLPDFFNPRLAPEAFLPFLAWGVGVELEADWPREKQRALIAQAVELFQSRGTRKGLVSMVRVLTGMEVKVEEHVYPFTPLVLDGRTALDGRTVLHAAPRLEHCFTVRFPGERETYTPETLAKVHRILQTEKPSHTQYFLAFKEKQQAYQALKPWVLGTGVLGEDCLSAV